MTNGDENGRGGGGIARESREELSKDVLRTALLAPDVAGPLKRLICCLPLPVVTPLELKLPRLVPPPLRVKRSIEACPLLGGRPKSLMERP